MTTIQSTWSIRRICLISIIGAFSLLAILSLSVINQQFSKNYNNSEIIKIKYWANVLQTRA
jgi:hypothetical protein